MEPEISATFHDLDLRHCTHRCACASGESKCRNLSVVEIWGVGFSGHFHFFIKCMNTVELDFDHVALGNDLQCSGHCTELVGSRDGRRRASIQLSPASYAMQRQHLCHKASHWLLA